MSSSLAHKCSDDNVAYGKFHCFQEYLIQGKKLLLRNYEIVVAYWSHRLYSNAIKKILRESSTDSPIKLNYLK